LPLLVDPKAVHGTTMHAADREGTTAAAAKPAVNGRQLPSTFTKIHVNVIFPDIWIRPDLEWFLALLW